MQSMGIDGKAQSGSEADTTMIESETTLRRLSPRSHPARGPT